jgi:hypothetical protein
MTPETSPTPGIKRTSHVELTPGRKEGQHSVWDALTGIFEDLDRQGGGAEAEELEDTLDELRGLLEMHTQLRHKAVELEAMRLEVTRERDAALSMLYELEEVASPSGPFRGPFRRARGGRRGDERARGGRCGRGWREAVRRRVLQRERCGAPLRQIVYTNKVV